MKNIPMFTSAYGIATLILREIPWSGSAYVLVRSVWNDQTAALLEECRGFCRAVGAKARRLQIRVKGEDGEKYLAHTLNNTVVAPPRMLIAFLENNLNEDGSINIPEVIRPYMGGLEKIETQKK